ncbi:MAG: hypothetical protein A2682_02565 [Candidatus Terrybacteria bacterium RIFCSPHIGHO2_01_FULL_58_15]|uniref:Uncharacterized protein n=1 Tax=Terrybacteria sp. (strain RIFCSPHIGHO2_01_FULL_58_15) TaxID=1802363 RepID=A0A1G2PK02_TERXR|nr:MAG: hypothetical protein A2682_02565 [Candidatus Terrybacteria bacterium RIFCSPHIGHO2_01_FULL_58_15]
MPVGGYGKEPVQREGGSAVAVQYARREASSAMRTSRGLEFGHGGAAGAAEPGRVRRELTGAPHTNGRKEEIDERHVEGILSG